MFFFFFEINSDSISKITSNLFALCWLCNLVQLLPLSHFYHLERSILFPLLIYLRYLFKVKLRILNNRRSLCELGIWTQVSLVLACTYAGFLQHWVSSCCLWSKTKDMLSAMSSLHSFWVGHLPRYAPAHRNLGNVENCLRLLVLSFFLNLDDSLSWHTQHRVRP